MEKRRVCASISVSQFVSNPCCHSKVRYPLHVNHKLLTDHFERSFSQGKIADVYIALFSTGFASVRINQISWSNTTKVHRSTTRSRGVGWFSERFDLKQRPLIAPKRIYEDTNYSVRRLHTHSAFKRSVHTEAGATAQGSRRRISSCDAVVRLLDLFSDPFLINQYDYFST